MPAIALLDRNGVYGAQRFSVAAREHGVRPIIGANCQWKTAAFCRCWWKIAPATKILCELLTQAHLRSEKGKCAVRWDELPEFAKGWCALDRGAQRSPLVTASRNIFESFRRSRRKDAGEAPCAPQTLRTARDF